MQAFLESFNTPEEIAAECRKRGIKGVPLRCGECVVAELLKSEYPERFENGMRVDIHPRRYQQTGVVHLSRNGCDELVLPSAFNQFAMAFDECQYPDLIKESPNG